MDRRWYFTLAAVAVALVAAITGGWALRHLAGQDPAERPGPDVWAVDPCAGPDLEAHVVRAEEPADRTADIDDGGGAVPIEPNDLPTAAPSEPNLTVPAAEPPAGPAPAESTVLQDEPPVNLIHIFLVDSAMRPIPGFIALERVAGDPNVEPSAFFSIPEPAFQPSGGLLGVACDESGLLGRRFIWRKDAKSPELTVVLEGGAAIFGRVLGTDRRPVAGARVTLQTLMLDNRWRGEGGSPYATISDEEGNFHLDGVFVGPRVRCVAFLGTLSGQSRSLDLTPDGVAAAGDILLAGRAAGSGIIRGRLTDERDLPLIGQTITVRVERVTQEMVTDAEGGYTLTDMPTDRPVAVTIEVPTYGTWSRTTTADDFACDFQLVPQGWGALGQEAPPLFAATWFNRAPIALKDLRGRVVLLTFRDFRMDGDAGLATIRSLLADFGGRGLVVIAVYNHLSGGGSVAQDLVTTHITGLFEGAPIAGILDADPVLVADLMPPGRPPGVAAGATHWLYQVHERPASFLIDKKGIVRYLTPNENNLRAWIVELLEE